MRTTAKQRFKQLRQRSGALQGSNYDITSRCNLRCEGCLYFSGDDYLNHKEENDHNLWHEFFQKEAARGVNYAYIAGAEPSMVRDRIAIAAKYIPRGTISTNGSRKIPENIPYRIHLSLWGDHETTAKYRGANVNLKAFKNYDSDPRALAVVTVNALNIGELDTIAKSCKQYNLPLTFSYFSSTKEYKESVQKKMKADNKFFRISTVENNLMHTENSLYEASQEITRLLEKYPQTIKYSMHYDRWVSNVNSPYILDENGIATNCGNRLSRDFRHYSVDFTESKGKCCSPNINCNDCRAYSMSYASFLKSIPRHDEELFHQWLDVWELWLDMYMPIITKNTKSKYNVKLLQLA